MIPIFFILGIPALIALATKKTAPAAKAAAAANVSAASTAIAVSSQAPATSPTPTYLSSAPAHVSTEAAPFFFSPAQETIYKRALEARGYLAPARPRPLSVAPRAIAQAAPGAAAAAARYVPPAVRRKPIATIGTFGRYRVVL